MTLYEPVVFPDIESLLVDALEPLIDAPVVMAVPADHPDTDDLVAVARVGGPSREVVVDDATIVLEARSADRRQALALLQETRAQVAAMVGTNLDGVAISNYRESAGPAFFPDPDTRQPRYQMTVTLTCRGSVAEGS